MRRIKVQDHTSCDVESKRGRGGKRGRGRGGSSATPVPGNVIKAKSSKPATVAKAIKEPVNKSTKESMSPFGPKKRKRAPLVGKYFY